MYRTYKTFFFILYDISYACIWDKNGEITRIKKHKQEEEKTLSIDNFIIYYIHYVVYNGEIGHSKHHI